MQLIACFPSDFSSKKLIKKRTRKARSHSPKVKVQGNNNNTMVSEMVTSQLYKSNNEQKHRNGNWTVVICHHVFEIYLFSTVGRDKTIPSVQHSRTRQHHTMKGAFFVVVLLALFGNAMAFRPIVARVGLTSTQRSIHLYAEPEPKDKKGAWVCQSFFPVHYYFTSHL